jgi:FAD:protein FMN transferase
MIRDTRAIMGMPITIAIAREGSVQVLEAAFNIFREVDNRFSTYKVESEISLVNAGLIPPDKYSAQMSELLAKCEAARSATHGYFDIHHAGKIDPSGLVKGWSIQKVADFLKSQYLRDFFVDAGGDIVAVGVGPHGKPWMVGIRDPKECDKNIKILHLSNLAVATSGTSERGNHIYNPHSADIPSGLLALTVVGPLIEIADVLATTAFAMGAEPGLGFIASQPDYEAYAVTDQLSALYTPGFNHYQSKPV